MCSGVGVQVGHFSMRPMVAAPDQVRPALPTAAP